MRYIESREFAKLHISTCISSLLTVEVLGERVRNGKREIRVHWDGYDQSGDEWIDARQLHAEN